MMFGKFFQDKSEQKIIKAQLVSSEGLNSVPKEITSGGWKSSKKQRELHISKINAYSTCVCGDNLHGVDGWDHRHCWYDYKYN
jgi:hypothetical protein